MAPLGNIYIYIESDSKHRKKPVRSRGQRSGVRILDNIDVIISRGGESLVFPLSLVGRSVETHSQTRVLSRHVAMRNIDRMEKRKTDLVQRYLHIRRAFHSWSWFTRHPGTICERYLPRCDRCTIVV